MSGINDFSTWNWGYIFITFVIVLFFIAAFSILIKTVSAAIAGGFLGEITTWFFLIIGKIYDYSDLENILLICCPNLDAILRLITYIGYLLLFLQFIVEGGIQLIVNSENKYAFPIFRKVFLPFFIANGIGHLCGPHIASLTKGYLCWICN